VQLLERVRQERNALLQTQDQLRTTIREAQQQLDRAPRWARGRRRDLSDSVASSREQIAASLPEQVRLEEQLSQTARLVDAHTRQRQTDQADEHRPSAAAVIASLRPVNDLARPRPRSNVRPSQLSPAQRPASRTRDAFFGVDPTRSWEPPGRDAGGRSR
jgi:paraquat-inducible protein B